MPGSSPPMPYRNVRTGAQESHGSPAVFEAPGSRGPSLASEYPFRSGSSCRTPVPATPWLRSPQESRVLLAVASHEIGTHPFHFQPRPTPLRGGSQDLARTDNRSAVACRSFFTAPFSDAPLSRARRRREASRCVALTGDVPAVYPRVAWEGDSKCLFAGISRSPLTDSNRRPPPYHGGFGLLLHGQ